MSADAKSSGLFGIAGVVMALCCLAGPAVVGAVAGAAIGDPVGVAAAVLVALAGVLAVRRWRRGNERVC
jgi:hypothetical protein